MSGGTPRLPFFATCSAEEAAKYARDTERGRWSLLSWEVFWQERYVFLKEHGYQLRPRFAPNWTPSWIGTNYDPFFCEDSILSMKHIIVDATRISDGARVTIKTVSRASDEIAIGRFLSSKDLLQDPTNHCVPVIDVMGDPHDSSKGMIVMPYLRPFDNPPLRTIGEVVDFIEQTLQGLCFIHAHGVAHRDCAAANIMMDARSLFPQGHHPVRLNYSPDGIHEISSLNRQDHPVRYYFIDFGLSSRFEGGDVPLVVGTKGRDKEPPELSDSEPYNPFPLDIFILGNLYLHEFVQKYHGLDFLNALTVPMLQHDPNHRPSAQACYAIFQGIQASLTESTLRWRLRSRQESAPERVVYDTVAVAREGIYRIKHMIV
ncbi:hypothetical protein QCA50_004816 [Cerrena zonata]|uniref:Protein kinase domain-containing protein n=1 Tax=Cerrena zonata TaxID=2478898 RepID=A0AAW0GFL4_9APHY